MKEAMEKVLEFHKAFDLPVAKVCRLPSNDERNLRLKLLLEEHKEYVDGERDDDMVEIADGLADMVYIICGTALCYGIPLDVVFSRVHASNMKKLGPDGRPIVRADGKVVKPEGWKPPDVAGALEIRGWKL